MKNTQTSFFIVVLLLVAVSVTNCDDPSDLPEVEFTCIVTGLESKAETDIYFWLIDVDAGRLISPSDSTVIDSDGKLTIHHSGQWNVPQKLRFGLFEDGLLWAESDLVTKKSYNYKFGETFNLTYPTDFYTYKDFRSDIKF
jgi:hypothetical protein